MWPGDVAGIHVSFVVIAYNEAGNIGQALDGITALAGLEQSRYEVIVVNDGSRDGTASVVASRAAFNPHIKLIDLPQNQGRGYARATGITAARGELIATIDADILLPVNWFSEAMAALADYDAVGGTAIPDGDVGYVYKASQLVPRVVGHTTVVTGSNAVYRRKVFDLVTFDPSLREGEDVALNKAIAQHGLSFATIPDLIVDHIENKTFPDSIRWLFVTGKGATRQFFVYRQVRIPDLTTAIFLASLVAGGLVAAVASLIAGIVIPLALLLAASVQHVRSRFETPLSRLHVVCFAVVLDAAHLLAYFAGRVVGLKWLLDRRATVPIHAPGPNSVSRL
jgi:glycosyltransferase involved in cell wall biosynthesis